MRSRDFILTLARENLQEAQTRMKLYENKKITEREYSVGDVGNYIYIYIYIYIGVNGNDEKLHPFEPLQLFKLHPLVSYKFRPPSQKFVHLHFSCI